MIKVVQAVLPPKESQTDGKKTGRRRHEPRIRQVRLNGRHQWVLEDDIGILEIADSLETLARDHPKLPINEQ